MRKFLVLFFMILGISAYSEDAEIVEKLSFSVNKSGVKSVETTNVINLYTKLAVDYIRNSKNKFVTGTYEELNLNDFIVVYFSTDYGNKPKDSKVWISRSTLLENHVEKTIYKLEAEFDGEKFSSEEGLLIERKKGNVIRNDIVEYKTLIVKKEFPNLYQ